MGTLYKRKLLRTNRFRTNSNVAGTFAVVTRVYLKAYPAFETINTVSGQVICQDNDSYIEMIGALLDLQVPVRNAGQAVCFNFSNLYVPLHIFFKLKIKTGYLGDIPFKSRPCSILFRSFYQQCRDSQPNA